MPRSAASVKKARCLALVKATKKEFSSSALLGFKLHQVRLSKPQKIIVWNSRPLLL